MRRIHGFSLVELLVALFVLSEFGLALTMTLVASQRTATTTNRWMHAAELATEGMEQLRAGHPLGAVADQGFERTGSVKPWSGHAGLYQLEVTVSWIDGSTQVLNLVTLARR